MFNALALTSIAAIGLLLPASSDAAAATAADARDLQLRKGKDRVLAGDDDCLSISKLL